MKKHTLAALLLSVIAGCASTTPSGQAINPASINPNASLANVLVSLAGYPGLVADNGYSQTLDAAVNAGSLANLLPGDVGVSQLTAGSLGFALTALEGTYPMDDGASFVVLQPIKDAGDVNQKDFVEKTVKATTDVAKVNQKLIDFDPVFAKMLGQADLEKLACQPTGSSLMSFADKANFNHSCHLPPLKNDVSVRVGGVYEGHLFDKVMPDVHSSKYAVVFIRSTFIKAKAGVQNIFAYERGVMTNSIAVLPFISPNSQGKHLVYLNGKATLL